METKKNANNQSNLESKEQHWRSQIPDFKVYSTAIVTKIWNCHKNRHENQWNRTEDPDTNPYNYDHLIFDRGAQNMSWKR
jgi:hypothetical protein